MTIKKFRDKLSKIIDDSAEFVTWDNRDDNFSTLEDDEMAITEKGDKEAFAIKITKVSFVRWKLDE